MNKQTDTSATKKGSAIKLPALTALAVWAAVGAAGLISTMLAAVPPASASGSVSQSEAREAMLRGEIKPLGELLKKVEEMYRGEILAVELESEDYYSNNEEIIVYEIKVLTPKGNIIDLEFNAANLELLNTKGSDDN